MHRGIYNLGRIASILALGTAALVAQGTQTGNITGEIVGKDGAPIAGATVRLSSTSMQGTRVLVTDEKGRFSARLLPPGMYSIVITKDGMQQITAKSGIGIGQTFEPRYQMVPTGSAVVEVISTAGEVDKTDTKTATNYSLDKVDQLPNARSIEGVALLTPGVTTGVGGRVTIRGGMTSDNLYLLDGQNINDNAYNNRGVRLIDDSIEEVQVITGAISAEYGDVSGGVMNAITRSGGNEFAGQLRWELSNPAWNAMIPYEATGSHANKLNEEKTLSLSGFIIKDRLWFAGSFFQTDQTDTGTIGVNIPVTDGSTWGGPWGSYRSGNATTAQGGFGAQYDTGRKEIRRTFKLTWAINQNHTLVGSFTNARIDDVNRNYSAGEIRSLVPQISTSEFKNLQWRAIWSGNLTSELKIGEKKQMLGAGGAPEGGSPIYNYDTGGYFNNGIFNSTDGGDNRNNKTANAKVSWFFDAVGSHQMDIGIDYYKGIRRARNEQTPTGYIFGVAVMNLGLRMAVPQDVWTYESTLGEATNTSTAFYVNDKWSLNKHLAFNIGLRFDKFEANNETGKSTASATALSPRLGMKYDLKGDGVYTFGLAYSKYNAKASEGVLNSVTGQGNPAEIDHPYVGPYEPQSFAFLSNLSSLRTLYDFNEISYYSNPAVNVRLADGLKAPTTDELQLSFQYSFNSPSWGAGFVKLTAVDKKWNNLLDYRMGNDGTVTLPTGGTAYLRVWENSDIAERKYKGLELESSLTKDALQLGLSATWSELKGNYEGEGTSQPGRGQGLKYFTVLNGVKMYDWQVNNAYGYLSGHVPLRIRAQASYVSNNAAGKTTFGLVYRFDSGARFSKARTITRAALNPGLPSVFGTSATQYDGERGGAGSFDAQTYVDFAITHDFPLFKVAGKQVWGFGKFNIFNIFNHQQLAGFGTGYASASSMTAPWVKSSTFGAINAAGYWGSARSYTISAGFRF